MLFFAQYFAEADIRKMKNILLNMYSTVTNRVRCMTPFAVHYEKISIHLRKMATNCAKIHSLAPKNEHLRLTQMQ